MPMLDWIAIAGCAGGIGGFVFGVAIERTRRALVTYRAELHEQRVRAIALGREVTTLSPAAPAYTNGSAHAHEQHAPLDA